MNPNVDSFPIGKEPCPLCRAKGGDNSGDNCVVYSNGGKYCFSCEKTIKRSDDLIEHKKYSEIDFPVTDYNKEHWLRDKETYSTDPAGFRGLKKATCDLYQVYHEFDEIEGKLQVVRQYYPLSKDGNFSGVKVRIAHPKKDFLAKGYCKTDCELFGQAVFRASPSRWIIIASGELDALSASQMINSDDSVIKKDPLTGENVFPIIPVVSGTAGEASSLKQYKANYEFLDKFETIFIIPDKDDKGEEALHKVAQALPKNKLKVIDLPAKDANAMLEAGRNKDFVRAFWRAKQYSPAGILGSDQLYEKMLEKAKTKKIEFPGFLEKLNEVTGGGMTLGSIINITGGCYPADTEFFTGTEWKPICSYKDGDSVLVYNKDTRQTYLDKPLEYVVLPTDQFYEFSNGCGDTFVASEHHKHLLSNQINGKDTITTREFLDSGEELINLVTGYMDNDVLTVDSSGLLISEVSFYQSSPNMYCFTTNTGFFVVRQKGQIYVSGNSGSGKSTLANEVVKHHILKKDYGVGIISLESDAGDYAENLLSAHLQEKLHWIKDPEEKVKYLQQDNVKAAAKSLFYNADGTPSFHMIDERGDYQNLQSKIEELIISCDVQIILIDVLSDVFDGESLDFQSKWMAWEKATVKRYPVTIINVVHTRKASGGQKSASTGGTMTEEDISGSSTQYKSASLNLIISRNKVAEEETLKNIMTINLFKNRQTGWTGEACQLYYDSKRHGFTELEKWFEEDPERAASLGLDTLDPISDMKHKENNKEREKNGLKPVTKPDIPLNKF